MAIGSGLGGQLGLVDEVTYGTYVAPTRFLEFNQEGLEADVAHLESRGIGTGPFLKAGRHKDYVRGAKGSIELDVMSKGFGLPFKYCLGSYANANVVGSENKATIQPDAAGLAGVFFTTQIGRPDIGGTVRPFNYEGCKVTSWELKAALDDWLKLSMEIDAETEQTSSALAAASYASGAEPFAFSEGAVTLGGVSQKVKSFSIKGANGLATSRRFLGNSKLEPLANAEFSVTGTLDFELEALTRHTALLAGTDQANLIITFTTPTSTGGGGGPFKIVLTVPALYFTGGAPKVGGPDVVAESMEWKALKSGSDPVIKIEYHSTDAAA